jgi:hypothetical protein
MTFLTLYNKTTQSVADGIPTLEHGNECSVYDASSEWVQ